MIILFDESTNKFDNLGLGVLKDAIDCTVKESLNNTFELEMNYPVSGSNYSKLQIGRLLFTKPNPYDNQQAFRIQSITKPIKGIVTVYATHISYDMNGIPVKQIDATGLNDACNQIKTESLLPNEFNFYTDISIGRTFKTTKPYNMRAILMGDDENSLLGKYEGEVKFDNFNVYIKSKRGKNRGAKVTYGFNMTDLNHQTNTDLLYNGVFPYYHTERTSTETKSSENFTQVYIVGSIPFIDGWLAYSEGGEPYHPLDDTPVQIATDGDYYQKVYAWSESRQKFVEKIYNESVTLVEGVISPSWIIIDWSKFPIITCRANANGYFKLATDDNWSDLKGVGDVIFYGNILQEGISLVTSNLIIYYSEVIPSGQESTTTEVTEVVDVVLDDPIIKINTAEANSMKYDRILSLDLTSEFDSEPSQDDLEKKAINYISKNKIGTVRHTTEVSFIDLHSTTEKDKYKNFDHIELGDTVRVIYSDLGVDVELRVITTEYDALTDRYITVTLGEKEDKLSNESIQNGDNISSLSNDVGYADITTVNKLIAETVTAEFINAANAKLTNAQINQLAVTKISCSGIIEASQFVLDNLVAKLLVADNAKIAETLEAGNIKVAGDVRITSGSISIKATEADGPSFIVDRNGNVTANSVAITGGTFNINDGRFEVTPDGTMYATDAYILGGGLNINDRFIVDNDGSITATSGIIAGFEINPDSLYFYNSSETEIYKELAYKTNAPIEEESYAIVMIKAKTNMQKFDFKLQGKTSHSTRSYVMASIKNSNTKPTIYSGSDVYTSTYNKESDEYIDVSYENFNALEYIYIVYKQSDYAESTGYGYGYFYISEEDIDKIDIIMCNDSTFLYSFEHTDSDDIIPISLKIGNNFIVDKLGRVYSNSLSITSSTEKYLINLDNGNMYIDTNGTILGNQVISADIYANNIQKINFNIWDEYYEKGSYDISDGRPVENQNVIRNLNPIYVDKSYQYYIKNPSNCYITVLFYDSNDNYISYIIVNNGLFTTPNTCSYINFYVSDTYGDSYMSNICINKNNSLINGRYFKHNDNIFNLPNININGIGLSTTSNVSTSIDLYFECSFELTPAPDYNVVNFTVLSKDSEDVRHPVPEKTKVTVYYTYTYNRKVLNGSIDVIFEKDRSSAQASVNLGTAGMVMFGSVDNVDPPYKTYNTGTQAGNMSLVPDEDELYNFGNSDKSWLKVYSKEGVDQTSDARCKKDISYDISKYESIFDDLKPVSFKFISDKKGITHLGFIAQDIKQSLLSNKIASNEFACLNDNEKIYSLNYAELHALEVMEIQKLKNKIKELEEIIKKENKNDNL